MAFRNVMIENPAHISLKNEQLIIHTDRAYSLPVEDLSALLLGKHTQADESFQCEQLSIF